jgi:hypothetical protein
VTVSPGQPEGRELALFVGPTNYAGQGHAWARAVEAARPGARAVSCAIADYNLRGFPADQEVALEQLNDDPAWQRRQFERLAKDFTHVLIEAFRPVLGGLFGRDPFAEADRLAERGLRVAMIAHGTDVRIPSVHARENEF